MKALERKYSKSDRIIAKAKFTSWVFLRQVLIAAILGGLVAVLWIFRNKIEGVFTKDYENLKFLTDDNMRWILLGCGGFVLLCVIIQAISLYSRECVLTESRVAYRIGFLNVKDIVLPLTAIKMVESESNIFQRLLHIGSITIITDAEKPYRIKNVTGADRFARRIMKQINDAQLEKEKKMMQLQLTGHPVKMKNH